MNQTARYSEMEPTATGHKVELQGYEAWCIFGKMNPSLIEELESRGYDITTIKCSIMKKATP